MIDFRRDRSAPRNRFAKVLEQCRNIVLIFSDAQMSEMFENVSAALLEFAERAENNTMQGRFFEAMNLIQQQRPDIEQSFRQRLTEGFSSFEQLGHTSDRNEQDRKRSEDTELSLVEPDVMEEDVAAENLVIRANAHYFPELFALSQRLSVINGGRKLKDYQIPAGPHHLVQSFRFSISPLEMEVKIKVILYALFDKYIVKQSKSIYDELNGTLKAAGVLPNLKPVHVRPRESEGLASRRRQHRQDAAAPASSDAPQRLGQQPDRDSGFAGEGGTESLGSELFASIIELMSTRRTAGGIGSAHRGPGPAKPVPQAVAEESSRRLVGALDAVQARATTQDISDIVRTPGGVPSLEVDTDFLERVKITLSEEREQALSQIDRENLSPMDADLIDLIGMLFEYMLNDPVLPNLAKALFSHLHTPYLKVALIDRRLLVDANHPARQLLDHLVESGSLWVDEANPQRGIFPAMQRVVDRVLQEFSNDVALFEELLKSFESDMNEQQRRTDTMEQRTQEAARGREKLQLAKKRAAYEIQTLLRDHGLPQPVVAFLSKTWRGQLVFILLRDKQGERGEAWRKATDTSRAVVGLFEPGINAEELSARRRRVPDLKRAISEAVQRMGSYSHSALDSLFELLDTPQSWVSGAAPPAARPKATTVQAKLEEAEALEELEEAEQASAKPISEQEKAVINRLRKMKFGTWFEFISSTGAAPRRIKLSWLSPLTSTCMFVDRSGMQAEIKTLQELAQEILSGQAKVIPRPKHPFIERAMVSIRKMLQGDAKEKGNSGTAKS
jgi:hypothetical protein